MIIPNFVNIPFVMSNLYLSDQWSLILQNLFTQLQNNLSNNGFQLPQLTTSQVNDLKSQFNANKNVNGTVDPSPFYGRQVYNTDTNKMMFFTFETSTPHETGHFVDVTTS